MKILETYPPNYDKIKLYFSSLEEGKPIFAYKDTIFNPFKVTLTKDLEIHEEVHSIRQGNEPEVWWTKYLENPSFRLEEEIMAYGTQLKFINSLNLPSKIREWKEEKMAEALSSKLYGDIISYGEAKSKIRNYARNI